MNDLMDDLINADAGPRLIWQINRGLLSPLFLPEPAKLLTLPEGVPRWQKFDLNLGPQATQNITVNFGFRTWILAIIGTFDQPEGFKATFLDAANKRNIFGTTRESSANLVGSASNPAWLTTPYELPANAPLFVRVTNVAKVQGLGEIVIYSHMEGD